MQSVRLSAAEVQLEDGKLLVTGGSDDAGHILYSSEMLTKDGWESKIPFLPVTIAAHCMVTVNSTTVMVIGGIQNGRTSANTFYFTFGEKTWTKGPVTKLRRRSHSCGKIRSGKESQEMSIIVAGGTDEYSVMSSVEILDKDSNEWKRGPELPFGIGDSQIVEDRNEGVVLINKGMPSISYPSLLFRLQHGGSDAVWTKMEQMLTTERMASTAFLVPDNIVDCS